ncbi:unnamed protein product [Paramecium pentaurelia]|uniref:Uncharacterized protein n=1 Tax=Paramecium pentaurelia TaxID=43138 RepID=A0A8S1WQK6_9CILI|nr:unnamed protein product [Paramecium pentaurelia]
MLILLQFVGTSKLVLKILNENEVKTHIKRFKSYNWKIALRQRILKIIKYQNRRKENYRKKYQKNNKSSHIYIR